MAASKNLGASPAVAAASGKPRHAFVQANGQGAASLEGGVVLFPVGGAVARLR